MLQRIETKNWMLYVDNGCPIVMALGQGGCGMFMFHVQWRLRISLMRDDVQDDAREDWRCCIMKDVLRFFI